MIILRFSKPPVCGSTAYIVGFCPLKAPCASKTVDFPRQEPISTIAPFFEQFEAAKYRNSASFAVSHPCISLDKTGIFEILSSFFL